MGIWNKTLFVRGFYIFTKSSYFVKFKGGLFDDAPMGEVPPVDQPLQESSQALPPPVDSDDDMDHFGGPPSMGGVR